VAVLHRRVRGGYAAVAQIAGVGLLAFRDPFGIRPLCLGINETPEGVEYLIASESVALEGMGFRFVRDIAPGEAVFIDNDKQLHARQCADNPIAEPMRVRVRLPGPSGLGDRRRLGVRHPPENGRVPGRENQARTEGHEIDVVMPIPDSSRPAAIQLALALNVEYREGFIKNRYIGRTFIMPGQAARKKSVRQKLNAIRTNSRQGRAAGGRLHRARHHQPRDRADGARLRRQKVIFARPRRR
jgi:amidophosphoribosyltransferase